jgi:hypothetical protein
MLLLLPKNNEMIKSTMKIKNNILAIPAALAAIPKKPKMPAIIAITRKISVHLSMSLIFEVINKFL